MPESSEFLYRLQVTRPEMLSEGPTDEEAAVVAEHFDYLKELWERGVVLLAGRTLNTDETSFGIVILTAASEQLARNIMQNDPAVRKGVMQAVLFPYGIALMAGRS